MIGLSDLISLVYIAVGVLVLRQIFKKNLLLRCTSCRTFGTLKDVNASEIEVDFFLTDDNLIDSDQVPQRRFFNNEFYKCRKCGHVVKFK